MPTNKTSPAAAAAAETKAPLPKTDTQNNEQLSKAAIASCKQNPYYSPLYDCDVNYFRYAFSSDSLTIKSAVAIKSIDIKPLKKEEKSSTAKSANKSTKSSETASDSQSTNTTTTTAAATASKVNNNTNETKMGGGKRKKSYIKIKK